MESPNQNMKTVIENKEKEMSFKDKVAVVTGAGGGIGRLYAIELARRGAKVVVNDLGSTNLGIGSSSNFADRVVKEIISFGGVAIPSYDSVVYGDKLIKTAIDNFGRIDILINNAGYGRPAMFRNMKKEEWDVNMDVHLNGVFACTKAAMPYFIKQNYGRIINTASPFGLYGNIKQSNYSCGKAGNIGFTKSLAKEVAKYNILVNCICPIADTRLTEGFSEFEKDKFKAEFIPPLVVYLSHESCKVNGGIFETWGRHVMKLRWQRSEGYIFNEGFTVEDVQKNFKKITDFNSGQPSYPDEEKKSFFDELMKRMSKF